MNEMNDDNTPTIGQQSARGNSAYLEKPQDETPTATVNKDLVDDGNTQSSKRLTKATKKEMKSQQTSTEPMPEATISFVLPVPHENTRSFEDSFIFNSRDLLLE
jgi:hypothetical protein